MRLPDLDRDDAGLTNPRLHRYAPITGDRIKNVNWAKFGLWRNVDRPRETDGKTYLE